MKKIIIVTILIAFMAATTPKSYAAPVRGSLCKVIAVSLERDQVTFMDCNGFTWIWADADDINPGEFYTVVFNTKNTNDIKDDEIMDINYEPYASWN